MTVDIPRIVETEIKLEMTLRSKLAVAVIEVAERRKVAPVELLADVLEAVFEDDLVDAVLER